MTRKTLARNLPILILAVSAIVSVGFTIGFCIIMPHAMGKDNLLLFAVESLLALGALLWPLIFVVLVLIRAFSRSTLPDVQFRFVVAAYLSLIFVFAGFYFLEFSLTDFRSAADQYNYRHAYGSFGRPDPRTACFTGVSEHLWADLDDCVSILLRNGYTDTTARYVAAANRPFEEVVYFRHSAVFPVISDMVHLSVMTITTVGYGNIAPVGWQAKLATDLEALSGTFLLVVALGLVLVRYRPESVHKEKSRDTEKESGGK